MTPLPPWLVLAGVLGVINAAACFMLVGRDVSRLAWYAVVGMLAASLGQAAGAAMGAPDPLKIGDVNVLTVSVSAWMILGAARVWGL